MSQVHETLGSIFGPPSAFTRDESKKPWSMSLNFSYIQDPAIWECIKPAMESLAGGTAFYFDSRGDLTLKDHLYQLLVVTEKYDMTQTLSPWASTWFQPYAATNTSSADGEEIVMWISWELGHEGTFCNWAKNLLLKSKINDEGDLLDSNSIALNTYTFLEPPGILETIASTRETVIHEMTRVLYGAIEAALKNGKCEGSSDSGCSYNSYNARNRRPITMTSDQYIRLVLGSLIQQVHNIGLQDVALLQSATPKYLGSINDLSSAIQSIEFSSDDQNHIYCNPLQNIKDKVESLVANIESPVTGNHLEYLRTQAKKTGV
ncbi:hypothetical protein Brms1b_003734 [Colletotrichum noveboracense]|nr:hypothetical protein CBS470a_001704 [Colletotrichum nupharicola]KAJ0319579.1 hypothetical protein Brms1b_003734 [Colletotrichum noveboracense]